MKVGECRPIHIPGSALNFPLFYEFESVMLKNSQLHSFFLKLDQITKDTPSYAQECACEGIFCKVSLFGFIFSMMFKSHSFKCTNWILCINNLGVFCSLGEQSLGVPLLELALYNKDNASTRLKGEREEGTGTFLRWWAPSLLTSFLKSMSCGVRKRCFLDPECKTAWSSRGTDKWQGHCMPAGSLLRPPPNSWSPAVLRQRWVWIPQHWRQLSWYITVWQRYVHTRGYKLGSLLRSG